MKNNKFEQFIKNPKFHEHRYGLMITIVVLISLIITAFSLHLYHSSGAALLDLSRPGYKSVRSQTDGEEVEAFPSTGKLDREALDKYQALLDQRSKKIDGSAFSRDILSDEALGMGTQTFENTSPTTEQ